MKISTGFVDKNGEDIFYGDIIEVPEFNGVYNYKGLCSVDMHVKLTPIPDKSAKGFNWIGPTAYLDEKAKYSLAKKIEIAPQSFEWRYRDEHY